MEKDIALLLIDVQQGFLDPRWGKRNNPEAEKNIGTLLTYFRKVSRPIIHIQHLSTTEDSLLRPGQSGVEFSKEARPQLGERIFQKTVHSAFVETSLEAYLRAQGIQTLVIVGIATDHCVSTNTRVASNLGFAVFVVEDATATFERQGKTLYPPELVHDISLASLNGQFAKIVTMAGVINQLSEKGSLH